jgi:pilus assembly protein CpaE
VNPDVAGTPDDHLNALIVPFAPNLDCILAPVVPGDDEAVPTGLVQFVVRQMALRYEYVVIDTPARFSDHVLTALEESDVHLLVTTPSIPALKNLRLTLDMLDVLGYPAPRRAILLNAADPKIGVTAEQVAATVRGPIIGEVPYSHDVPIAINEGHPLALTKADHPFSVAVRQVARAFAGEPVNDHNRRRFGKTAKPRK